MTRLALGIVVLLAMVVLISCGTVRRECALTAVSPTNAWRATFPDGTSHELENSDRIRVIGSGYTEARIEVVGEPEEGALFTAYVYCGRETVAGETTTEQVIVLGWSQ